MAPQRGGRDSPSERDHTSRLGILFQQVTGETSVTTERRTNDIPSHAAADGLDGYKRRHDELSRHEALSDALSDPDV